MPVDGRRLLNYRVIRLDSVENDEGIASLSSMDYDHRARSFLLRRA